MNILVSACLLGKNCKYNGTNNRNEKVIALAEKHNIIPICPESFAKLPVPRPPAEIKNGRVYNKNGEDLTEKFKEGAKTALEKAIENGCTAAVLKERSPSCGYKEIYDGTFSGKTICGNGIAAQLLHDNGITIFGESEVDKLQNRK